MKKSSLTALFVTLLTAFNIMAACGSDSKDSPSLPGSPVDVAVSPEALSAGPEGGTLELHVKADADWAVSSDADWVTVKPSGGLKGVDTKLSVKVSGHDGMDERTAGIDIISGGKTVKSVSLVQGYTKKATPSLSSVILSGLESSAKIRVSSNAAWTLSTESGWISVMPDKGEKGDTDVEIKVKENDTSSAREGVVMLECGGTVSEIKVSQLSDSFTAPEGYSLVWSDEFNEGVTPGGDWVLENWAAGHVNNELQTYTSRQVDGKWTAEIKDGFLNINCFKGNDGKVYSARMNARPSKGWLYGYFEARIMLPAGKGTWPAFWMMPCNVDWNTNGWPKCGEIDIMEEVGANPDYVSSPLHTQNYNHTKGTQKTHEMKCVGAEGSFHVYALEWTEDEIITYVDGNVQLRATRASMGTDHDSWPFHYAFYPILNLAWGGDWGGYKGIDESALPVTMKVDYVRVFQKN
ncbi:MAG: family 16 glycosylhydrolase [Muribaculaceae bacterium]|nr:family 16 glycosylhydrolase [Muribaculaceae bacterium]